MVESENMESTCDADFNVEIEEENEYDEETEILSPIRTMDSEDDIIQAKLTTVKVTDKSVFGELKYLPFSVNTYQGTMMIDTGSAGNYISEKFYNYLKKYDRSALQYDDITYEETIVLGDSRPVKA